MCTIEHNSQIFPLTFLDKIELNELNGIDLPSQLSSLPPYEVRSKLMKLHSLNDFDMDEKLVNAIDSKYYDISELHNVYNPKSSFSLFHSSLRSLSKHIDELQILLRSTKIPFDIIGVSETKEQVENGFLTNVNLYGYDFYSQPSKASAGGVAIYIKSSLNYVIRDDLNRTEDEFECIWVEIKNSKSQSILCCCAYRHPNSETQKFLDYIESTLSMAKKEKKLLFIMGDFNFNLLNYESHTETNDFLNTMISHYMLPYILQPTRVTDHSATVIDNIFSNNTEHNTLSGSILSRISDHFPQFLVMTKVNIDYKRCSFAKRDFSNLNEQKFISDFSNINHSFLYDNDKTLNYKFDTFYENLNSYVNHHVPTKKMTKKDLKFCSKPWINSRIKNLMKYRDRLLRKLNKKYTLQNEYLYKKFRNRVVNELRTSKIDYYKKYFTEHRDNIKMLWNGIRSIINVQNSKFNNISQIIQNGQIIKNPKDIPESLNQYFVNVADNIDKEIPRTRKCPLDYMGVRNISSFFVSPSRSHKYHIPTADR